MQEIEREVWINREPVELFKILKFEGMTNSGGDAKLAIANGLVKVNGAVETRKRKKMVAGDIVEFDQERFILRLEPTNPYGD